MFKHAAARPSTSWIDINAHDRRAGGARRSADEIDILVDLNGYTKSARTKMFSLRPAPIIVNWFGFPGTMGSPYHHYIIADHIIPPDSELYYSEKVVRLPCYQPNDRKRIVAARAAPRRDEGLPEDAFVFCCLNGMQKITPLMFASWMSILAGVPGSVLWLLGGAEDTNDRLRRSGRAAAASRRSGSSSRQEAAIPTIWPATRSPICSWTPPPMAPTPPPPTRCGWACRC